MSNATVEACHTASYFYFVHSFHVVTSDAHDVLGTTTHGQTFVSAVARGKVVGFQFHPEKSQANGIRLIDAFLGWQADC